MTPKLQAKTDAGKPRCQMRVTYGSRGVWSAGRDQCLNAARPGEIYCGTHLRQEARRKAERELEVQGRLCRLTRPDKPKLTKDTEA